MPVREESWTVEQWRSRCAPPVEEQVCTARDVLQSHAKGMAAAMGCGSQGEVGSPMPQPSV